MPKSTTKTRRDKPSKPRPDSARHRPLGLYRKGCGFYTFRHVFETVGGECRDQVAVDRCMGHERGDIASNSRERVSDERVRIVVDTVRDWLFGGPVKDDPTEPGQHVVGPFRVVG